jgi:hypothetical protein
LAYNLCRWIGFILWSVTLAVGWHVNLLTPLLLLPVLHPTTALPVNLHKLFHPTLRRSSVNRKSPVWATLPALIPLRAGYTQYGWAWKIIWEVGPKFTHTVTLHGTNVRTSTSLLFQVDDSPTTSPVLDPGYPGHLHAAFGDDWAEWGSYVFLPGTGCYSMEAMWPGGHWLVYFAAGN